MNNYYYLLPLFLIAYYWSQQDNTILCKVIKVTDGDSIKATCEGVEMKIRLVCIDAPEIKQEWGTESKNFLKKLMKEQNDQVKIKLLKTDRYGRTLGELYSENGEFLQLKIVQEGMAWGYLKYRSGCNHWYKIEVAEDQAKLKKVGLWSSPNQIEPWRWRIEYKK